MRKTNPENNHNKKGRPPAEGEKPVPKPKTKQTAEGADKKPAAIPKKKVQHAATAKTPAVESQPIATNINTSANTEQHSTPEVTMEVHHHPQLEHKPKPWKEYLLEGFMIFIAVMMGFIAENIREAIDNHEHVQQLTSQLVQDMKADGAKLDTIHMQEKLIMNSDDSLITMLQQPLAKLDSKKLQGLAIDAHSIWLYHPISGAIGAIKNELHLKQFSDSKIIGLIARYEEHIELEHTVENISLQYQHSYLDPFILQHFMPGNLNAAFQGHPIPDGSMRNLSQSDLTQLATDMALIRVNTFELLQDNERLKRDVVRLLQYLKQQYNVQE